ncbi:MAG: bifunctional UDP-N-acetylglucosamine diphosphorylase/glucosamine-1-phosphate N-acetyltransferase GlmU [bacterium]|nr:bifunctional UDP-N-acetylglucosamine diphosphorylase/glucosamine-1-phosphate N-acetyltransferase GlmU [bacterium]
MSFKTASLAVIVLAAGKGTRMSSSVPKVLHELRSRPLLDHVLDAAQGLDPGKIIVVTGQGGGQVQDLVAQRKEPIQVVIQEPQLGTGHAVAQCLDSLKGPEGIVAVLSGDVPRLGTGTVISLYQAVSGEGAAVSVLTGRIGDPAGYGRILRDQDGKVTGIREHRDLAPGQEDIDEVNFGVYAFDAAFLREELPKLKNANAQGEYYLTDIIGTAATTGRTVATRTLEDPNEARGINTLRELAEMEREMNRSHLEKLMAAGVRIVDPERTWIDDTVTVGPDTVIYPSVFLHGQSSVGSGCIIRPGAVITDTVIGDRVEIRPYCVITGSAISDDAAIGPFAHLRAGSEIGPSARIGNFVETKKAVIGEGSKVSHLTYVGDAELGRGVNIGAGCVTCNYDGFNKYRTVIEDGVFVGSGTMLVAPVTLGKGSLVGAGSTVTADVPPDALAVSRAHQSVKEGWAARRRARLTGAEGEDRD